MDLSARVYAQRGEVDKAISEYERLLKPDVSADVTTSEYERPARPLGAADVVYLIHPLYHYRLGHRERLVDKRWVESSRNTHHNYKYRKRSERVRSSFFLSGERVNFAPCPAGRMTFFSPLSALTLRRS